MNEQEFEAWSSNVNKVFYSQIILDRLKKKKLINKKQEKEIKRKIKKLRYKNILNSPHLEGKENLKEKVLFSCINDYCAFMGIAIDTAFS